MANDYKIYRVTGYYRKNKQNFAISVEVRASKIENALERVFSEVGSRHRVKREEIFIAKDTGVTEISRDEAKSFIFRDLDEEDFEMTAG